MSQAQDPYEYIQKLEQNNEELQQHSNTMFKAQSPSMFDSLTEENLIEYQLDLKEELNRIYHLLRGDQLKEDKDGNVHFIVPEDDDMKIFNEYGTQVVMQIVVSYLNKNTLLSNYDNDTINDKVFDIGTKIRKLIYTKYEKMGLDTPEKRKMAPIIVLELVDTIHSAYLRALKGGERESIRKVMHVAQTSNPMNEYSPGLQQPRPKRTSLFNLRTWGN